MKRRERKPARAKRHPDNPPSGLANEREELRRRQAQLDQAALAESPDGLVVSRPAAPTGPKKEKRK